MGEFGSSFLQAHSLEGVGWCLVLLPVPSYMVLTHKKRLASCSTFGHEWSQLIVFLTIIWGRHTKTNFFLNPKSVILLFSWESNRILALEVFMDKILATAMLHSTYELEEKSQVSSSVSM